MTSYNKTKRSGINMLHAGLFSAFTAGVLLLSACGSGGGKGGVSNNNNTPSDVTSIESIVVVSPTESGVINVVAGTAYSQKILVAGIDKNGTRKLLTKKDDLTYKLDTESYAKFNESAGTIMGTKSGKGILTLNLKKGNLTAKVPFTVESGTLESISISANESDASFILLPKNYQAKLTAKGTFVNENGKVTAVRDISSYSDLWITKNAKIAIESDTIFGATLFGTGLGTTQIMAQNAPVKSNSIDVTVLDASLDHFTITPNDVIVPFKSKTPMKAVATFKDSVGSFDFDITHNLVWSLESTQFARIDNSTGVVTTNESSGNIIVKAITLNKESSATAKLTIGNPVIQSVFIGDEAHNPLNTITMKIGNTQDIYPYGLDSNGKTVLFNSLSQYGCQWELDPSGTISLETSPDKSYGVLTALKSSNSSSFVRLACQNGKFLYTTNVNITD